MSIERKLAAIMFTDIAGFTEISAEDEENAFSIIEIQRQVLKPIVKGHGGKWLKEMGDGLLISFPSSIQAVDCAIAIQNAVLDINWDTYKEDSLEVMERDLQAYRNIGRDHRYQLLALVHQKTMFFVLIYYFHHQIQQSYHSQLNSFYYSS